MWNTYPTSEVFEKNYSDFENAYSLPAHQQKKVEVKLSRS